MQTIFCASVIFFVAIGSIQCQGNWQTGLGFNNKDPRYYIKVKSMKCESNPALVNITMCRMKPEQKTSGQFSIGLLFGAPESKMALRISVWSRFSANIYRPTPLQQSMDLCDFIANKKKPSLLTLFIPDFFKIIPIPDCPFKGKVEVNFTLPLLNVDQMISVTGDSKLILNLTRTAGANLMALEFEVFTKGAKSY